MFRGSEFARNLLESTSSSASSVLSSTGLSPSLTVITVGTDVEGETHPSAPSRRRSHSSSSNTWYDKVKTGSKYGVSVKSIVLPPSASTEDVIDAIKGESDKDGIQLMWPLPTSVDAASCYRAIPLHQDVDGLVPSSPTLPLTADAVLTLLKNGGVEIEGSDCVVVGTSKVSGSPIASALSSLGATVTQATSMTPKESLRRSVESADIVVSAVGVEGVVEGGWIKSGAAVVNVGKVYDSEDPGALFKPDITGGGGALERARVYGGTPGGVGPLCVALLMRNVVEKAMSRADRDEERRKLGVLTDSELSGEDTGTWAGRPLSRTFTFKDHPSALAFVSEVVRMADEMDHHPTEVRTVHHCTEGVSVELKYETYTVKGVTKKDGGAIQRIDEMWKERGGGVSKGMSLRGKSCERAKIVPKTKTPVAFVL